MPQKGPALNQQNQSNSYKLIDVKRYGLCK